MRKVDTTSKMVASMNGTLKYPISNRWPTIIPGMKMRAYCSIISVPAYYSDGH